MPSEKNTNQSSQGGAECSNYLQRGRRIKRIGLVRNFPEWYVAARQEGRIGRESAASFLVACDWQRGVI